MASYINCISANNSGSSSNGFLGNNAGLICINCIAYTNGNAGFQNLNGNNVNVFINCMSEGNKYAYASNGGWSEGAILNCGYYNSGTANFFQVFAQTEIGNIALSASPFTNAGSQDFSLNNTANAGALLRAAGLPGLSSTYYTFLGLATSSYTNVGATTPQALGSSAVILC